MCVVALSGKQVEWEGEGIILTRLIQVATAPFYQFNTHPYHPHTSFTGIFK
jgi:hypothetical protein